MNDPLRVLYITYDGIMEPIGSSQVLSYLKKLSEKNVKFDLVSFEKSRYLSDEMTKGKTCAEVKKYGIEWHVLRYHKRFRVLATLLDIMIGVFKALGIAGKTKPDIVHARSYIAASMAWVVCSLTGAKFVFDMRGFWADERVDAGSLSSKGLIYKIMKRLERLFVRKADKIVVLTHKAKEELVSDFAGIDKHKIKVIPCCADTGLFRFDRDAREATRSKYNVKDRVVFIHTGSLIGWYMIREMLEYFKTIKESEEKASFMLLSNSVNKDDFFKMVSNMNISKDDIMLTEAPFEDVHQYLSCADAGLFFIKPTFSKKASCPVKLAEYLSCGLPIICNKNIGDLNDIIEGNRVGVLVEDFDKSSYEDSYRNLKYLFNDRGLKARCRNVAERMFSVEDGAASYLKVYKDI